MNSNSVASGRANNNDCPALDRTCPTECYSISSTGCIVCQCPQSHGKITGISSHSFVNQIEPNPHLSFICSNLDNHEDLDFYNSDVLSFGTRYMVYMICNLYTASSQSSTSSNSTHTGAAASTSAGNNNGCPSFPTHCDPNCLALDGMGCPICSCPKSKKRNFVPRNIITTKPPLFYIYWFGVVIVTPLCKIMWSPCFV